MEVIHSNISFSIQRPPRREPNSDAKRANCKASTCLSESNHVRQSSHATYSVRKGRSILEAKGQIQITDFSSEDGCCLRGILSALVPSCQDSGEPQMKLICDNQLPPGHLPRCAACPVFFQCDGRCNPRIPGLPISNPCSIRSEWRRRVQACLNEPAKPIQAAGPQPAALRCSTPKTGSRVPQKDKSSIQDSSTSGCTWARPNHAHHHCSHTTTPPAQVSEPAKGGPAPCCPHGVVRPPPRPSGPCLHRHSCCRSIESFLKLVAVGRQISLKPYWVAGLQKFSLCRRHWCGSFRLPLQLGFAVSSTLAGGAAYLHCQASALLRTIFLL